MNARTSKLAVTAYFDATDVGAGHERSNSPMPNSRHVDCFQRNHEPGKEGEMSFGTTIYLPSDRVVITDGPMHGFTATIINAPEPGRLSLVIDGFHENSQFTVAESDVEPSKPDQPEPREM